MSAVSPTGTGGVTRRISLSQISVREEERLRPADPDRVTLVAQSMSERGQLQPIGVYRAPNEAKGAKPWVLIYGLHRFRAAEQLDWTEIEIKERPASDARLAEIEENLHRADLTALDRSIAINERRRIHEKEHGEVNRGGNQSDNLSLWSDELANIAEKIGLSHRSLERADAIGRNITGSLRDALRATDAADNQSLLIKIAKLQPKQKHALLVGLEGGAEVKEALQTVKGKSPASPKNRKDALFERVRNDWHQLDHDQQNALLAEIGVERLRQFIQQELADEA